MAAFDEQEYTKDFDLNIWKRLLPILARYKAVILAMITINGLTAVIDVAIPLFQQSWAGTCGRTCSGTCKPCPCPSTTSPPWATSSPG